MTGTVRRRSVALLLAVVLVVTAMGCSSDETAAPPGDALDRVDRAVAGALAPKLAEGQSAHEVRGTFQYDAFLVTVGDAVYDRSATTLRVGMRFENLSDGWSNTSVAATYTGPGVDTPSTLFTPLVDVPPRRSIDLTAEVLNVTEAPDSSARITWGRDDRDQPVLSIGGAHENLWVPADVAVDVWGGIGRYAVHVTGGRVQAADLAGSTQNAPGVRTLRLVLDTYALTMDPVNGFYPVEHLELVRPDGEKVEASGSSDGFAPASWTVTTENWIEFPVEADVAGDYELELTSQSPKAMGSLHPELIEHATMSFTLPDVDPGAPPAGDVPRPDLSSVDASDPTATTALPAPLDLDVTGAVINVGGFTYAPRRLTWDPEVQEATVTGDVAYVQTVTDEQPGGVLDIAPTFSFTAGLASGSNLFTGTIADLPAIPDEGTVEVDLVFLSVTTLDPTDLGLYLGPRSGMVSSAGLTADSPVPLYPPLPVTAGIDADPAVARDWSVTLTGYRTGFLQSTTSPSPGRLELEVFLTVTCGPAATDLSSGLVFTPTAQLFLAADDGYLIAATRDSGPLSFAPGETKQLSVTFEVSDAFQPGALGFVLRSNNEITARTEIVETTFGVQLGGGDEIATGGEI